MSGVKARTAFFQKLYDPKYIVLMGKVGVGKTTIFNKTTSSKEKVDDGHDSITRKVTIAHASYGDVPITIADTPGLSSTQDKLHHALSVRYALGCEPVHAIAVCVKFERYGPMLDNVSDVFESFGDYNDYVCVVITHWDVITAKGYDAQQSQMAEVRKVFLEYGINKVVFVGKDSSGEGICNDLAKQCSHKPVPIKIPNSQIYKKFDIAPPSLKLRQRVKTISDEFATVANLMREEMDGFSRDDEKDSFFHSCMVAISTFAQEASDKFAKEFAQTMDDMNNYAAYMTLKKKLAVHVKAVRTHAQNKMSFSLLDADNPRNKFRKCPFADCGTIWIKVEGCDGATTCGNPSFIKDTYEKPTGNFVFIWTGYAVKWAYTQTQKLPTKPVSSYYNDGKLKAAVDHVGCGRAIVWRDLPILSDLEFRIVMDSITDMGVADILVSDLKPVVENQIEKNIRDIDRTIEVDNRAI